MIDNNCTCGSCSDAQPSVAMTALDLDQGVLVLLLNMSLDAGLIIDCTQIGLNSAFGDPDNVYPLSSPAATPTNDEVSCALGADLFITIATDPSFGSAPNNTFIYISILEQASLQVVQSFPLMW